MISAIVGVFLLVLLLFPQKNIVYKTDLTVGTWWWHRDVDESKYLEFAARNSVNEIYYYQTAFDEKAREFVKKANDKGIKVYVLWGDKNWVVDSSPLETLIERYREYQVLNQDAQFEGIHLDIEPHQFSDFNENSTKREEYLTMFVHLVYNIVNQNSDIKFDFDIPAWFDDEITLYGVSKALYKHVIDIANRVFVMSYRDSAEKIIAFAEDELNYAKEQNKKIFLCVEMNSEEGDNVSFKEESKIVLYEQLKMLEKIVNQDFGVSIHYIETWYSLKDK